jgi:signal transduction histidine kinase
VLLAGWPLVLFATLLVLVSGFIVVRRPDLAVARVLMVGSIGNLASTVPWQLGLQPTDLVRGGPGLVSFALTGPINLLFWSAAVHIILVFQTEPDEGRRQWAVRAAWLVPPIALVVGVSATRLALPSTLAWIDSWAAVQSAVVGGMLVLALIGTVVAYRRAQPALRHDVRWIALAFALAAIAMLGFVVIPILLTGQPIATRPAIALLALPIPIALAVAVVRDRLFEIDVLRQSREALVVAREDERRRLRRDLHDGLGPSLAAMTLKLGVARLQVRDDPATAEALLDEITGETQAAIAEVRRLASGLRPPALDEVGLVEAIRRRAESFAVEPGLIGAPPRIEVVGPAELPTLSAAAEVAAYRIAVEAMTNAVRHAAAQNCRVTIGVGVGDTLELEVVDDGVGLPPGWRMGIGTASMRERAIELGGRCTIDRRPGGGTRVDAGLPFGAG